MDKCLIAHRLRRIWFSTHSMVRSICINRCG